MTLIAALQGKDGLVIAADSRGTIGDPRGLTAINDQHNKLMKLTRFCGIGIAGSSEFAAKAIDEIKKKLRESTIEYADEVLEETRNCSRSLFDEWFQKLPPKERPKLAITLVGYAKTHEGVEPRTYLISSDQDFAPMLFPNGNCLSGIPQYAIYLIHRLYDAEMTVENLQQLATYLISETATQDPKVGGIIKVASITPDKGYQELTQSKVAEIIKRNEVQSQNLKEFFFPSNGQKAGSGTKRQRKKSS